MTYAIDHSAGDRELARAERRVAAVRLRNAGASLAQVADKLGITPRQAQEDVAAGLREILREPAENLIANQQAIIRDVIRGLYAGMAAGDPKASAQILKALDHQARLFGLYAPTRVAHTITDDDFASTAARLMEEIGLADPAELGAPCLDENEWAIS